MCGIACWSVGCPPLLAHCRYSQLLISTFRASSSRLPHLDDGLSFMLFGVLFVVILVAVGIFIITVFNFWFDECHITVGP